MANNNTKRNPLKIFKEETGDNVDYLRAVSIDRNKDSYTRFYIFESGQIIVETSTPLEGISLSWFPNGTEFKKNMWENFKKNG